MNHSEPKHPQMKIRLFYNEISIRANVSLGTNKVLPVYHEEDRLLNDGFAIRTFLKREGLILGNKTIGFNTNSHIDASFARDGSHHVTDE